MEIKRHAMGRIARPGDLYDARTDLFCNGQSIIPRDISNALFEITPSPSVSFEIGQAKFRSERCKNLGLQTELMISALTTDFPLQGSATYLAEDKHNQGETTIAFVNRFRKSIEKLDFEREDVKQLVSLPNSPGCGATHFVTEVDQGLTCVFALSFCADDKLHEDDLIRDFSRAFLETLDGKMCGFLETAKYAGILSSYRNFRCQFFSDIEVRKHGKPSKLEEYATFLNNTAVLMNGANPKTVPVTYTLAPLQVLQRLTTAGKIMTLPSMPLDETTVKKLLRFMNDEEYWRDETDQFSLLIESNRSLFTRITAEAMRAKISKIERNISEIKLEIRSQLKAFRCAAATVESIECVLQRGNLIWDEVKLFLEEFGFVKEKLDYLGKMQSRGICCVANSHDFQKSLRSGRFFVFFATLSLMDEKFLENSALFDKLCDEENQKCILFDTDINQLEEQLECSVAYFDDGTCIEKDLCRLYSFLQREYNVVKFKVSPKQNKTKPHPRVRLEIACPKSAIEQVANPPKHEWFCSDCQKPVEYAFDKRFYCECGESETHSALWCCQDDCHGALFLEYEKDDLAKQMNQIKKWKEFNVLLIGETGAGKSTWINSIANYVIHGDLDAALTAQLTCLIPCSFSIQKTASDMRNICVGKSDNEVFETGKSATQKPKTYTFMYKNELVRLIDVPGVCDTRGPDQDRQNFDLILRELQQIPELHAICILLVPDAPKLTVAFQYCINELLTYLHKSAARNIVFCFTKTRQTFYKAGQTLSILKKYLDNFEESRDVHIPLEAKTMYYFDNEAFRLLCAVKDGVEFSEKETEAYRESWNISALETIRFLDYVIQLEPHLTREMLSLNEARRMILSLTKPLAEITENIDLNLRFLESEKKQIEHLNSTVADLQLHLQRQQFVLEPQEIDYPRTVCASQKCIETGHWSQSGIDTVYYKQKCHDPCYLQGVETETHPNPELKNCCAMRRGVCRVCNCQWDLHLHIRYLFHRKLVTVTDAETEKRLKEAKSDKAKKDELLKSYDNKIKTLRTTYKRITEICASFGAFLDHNSILPYNDAMSAYLSYAIKIAQQEAAVSKNTERVDYLQSYLKQYEEELKIFKSKITTNAQEITLEDILRFKKELYSMNTPECNIAEYLDAAGKADEKHQKPMDEHFEVGYKTLRMTKKRQSRRQRRRSEQAKRINGTHPRLTENPCDLTPAPVPYCEADKDFTQQAAIRRQRLPTGMCQYSPYEQRSFAAYPETYEFDSQQTLQEINRTDQFGYHGGPVGYNEREVTDAKPTGSRWKNGCVYGDGYARRTARNQAFYPVDGLQPMQGVNRQPGVIYNEARNRQGPSMMYQQPERRNENRGLLSGFMRSVLPFSN